MNIWTIGHSNSEWDFFLSSLRSQHITHVIDVRSGHPPKSTFKRYNGDILPQLLFDNNISYTHLPTLGGKRSSQHLVGDMNILNAGWRVPAFKNYADYAMISEDFDVGIHEIQSIATHENVAYMCAEIVPWRCHRRIITDYLMYRFGAQITHIISPKSTLPGTRTEFGKDHNDHIIYPNVTPTVSNIEHIDFF